MKSETERRKPKGFLDYFSLAITTVGVGYIPGAPGTWGSAVGVLIYAVIVWFETSAPTSGIGVGFSSLIFTVFHLFSNSFHFVLNALLLPAYCLLGIWASGRSIPLLGNEDPSEAVVDEVLGQLVTFCFVPLGIGWPFIVAGFLLFRLFDIWKPYPIDQLQDLHGGLGICADDLVAGVYAGICLAVIYAFTLTL